VQPAHHAPVVMAEMMATGEGEPIVLFGAQVGRGEPLPFPIMDASDAHAGIT
jgi:hypothetical protein